MTPKEVQTKGMGNQLRVTYECRCGKREVVDEEIETNDYSPPKKKKGWGFS